MSKIQVDAIEQQTSCGSTLTVGGGASKTVVVDATTVTLGRSGGTVALASGASQTGFGRTGTVDWQTGSIKTGTFVPVSGEGYFVDTSSGVSTANLPAGSAGAIVSFADYTRTFQTNNLTITPNGSEKVGGVAANFVAQTEGQSITLIYVDGTEGWINTTESTGQSGLSPAFVTATSPSVATVGDFKIHTFTGPGSFVVSCVGNPLGSSKVDYMVVAGGGGGGYNGGGGGAGGFRESPGTASGSYSVSPLGASPAVALSVTAGAIPITVGAGGAGGAAATPSCGVSGNTSSFSTISSAGGGKAGGWNIPSGGAAAGGSGGGGGMCGPTGPGNLIPGGAGNSPPVSPPQGNGGGQGFHQSGVSSWGGGGGGATVAGSNGSNPENGGNGGTGATSSINNAPTARAGGGGGRPHTPTSGSGGTGGGGSGGGPASPSNAGTAGTANSGGGGGGGNNSAPSLGAAGGSGVVIIRYKFQ